MTSYKTFLSFFSVKNSDSEKKNRSFLLSSKMLQKDANFQMERTQQEQRNIATPHKYSSSVPSFPAEIIPALIDLVHCHLNYLSLTVLIVASRLL